MTDRSASVTSLFSDAGKGAGGKSGKDAGVVGPHSPVKRFLPESWEVRLLNVDYTNDCEQLLMALWLSFAFVDAVL